MSVQISFQSGASDDDRERLLRSVEGWVIERKARFWKVLVEDSSEEAPLLLAFELSDEPIVKYAEPNALQAATFHQAPQDEPRFENQWTLRNTGQNGGTAGADEDALGAWRITTDSSSIGIVVYDSGVDINHPDLVANIGPGWDFYNNDNDATPEADRDAAHGTGCTGVIAAAANGWGVAGIAPG